MAEQPIPISEIADPDVIRVKLLASGKDVHAPMGAVAAASIHGAPTKTTPVDADEFGYWDSVGLQTVKTTWANIKATLNAIYDWATVTHAATGKTTPIDADEFSIVDTAASNVIKKLTWANLKATMWTAWGALINAGTGKTTPVDGDMFAIADSAASNATKKLTWANLKATFVATINTWSAVQTFSAIPVLSGGAISFPATQVPSAGANDLDDYEEGTWTGTATADTGTFTTVSVTETVYTKIGRVVTIHGAVNVTTAGTAAGDIIVNGAPFTSAGTTVGSGREYAVNGFVCWASINPGTTVRIRRYDNITIIASGISVRFTITYRV